MTTGGKKLAADTEERTHPNGNYTISDFTIRCVGNDTQTLTDLNKFFNSSQIKSELHWFTHRDTLERAAQRDDRRLYYFAPGQQIIGGLMVWCESRVLEADEAQIRLVAVDPDYRDYGVGRYLVNTAIDFGLSHGKESMIADVAAEAPAVEFWEMCGFSKTEEYETKGGRLMYRMMRRISE